MYFDPTLESCTLLGNLSLDDPSLQPADLIAGKQVLFMQTVPTASVSRRSHSALPHFDRPTYLMCPPHWYDVDYVINPWMAGNLHRPSRDRAFAQWRQLFDGLRQHADIRVLHAERGCPDMTFIAHTALLQHGVAALSSFAHSQRQPEEAHLQRWLEDTGFLIWETPRETAFEGGGDAIFDETGRTLWAAHGVRTCERSHNHLQAAWHVRVEPLHLTDPRFYHLDTCFTPLSGGFVLYYPEAFDDASRKQIEAVYSPEHRIIATEAEATQFACNVINIGKTILMGEIQGTLATRLHTLGFVIQTFPMSEFLCGGGSVRSLALRLSDPSLQA